MTKKFRVCSYEYKLCAAKTMTSGDVSGHTHYASSKKTKISQTVHEFGICFLSGNIADKEKRCYRSTCFCVNLFPTLVSISGCY